jgi:hypothetical protein
VHEGRWQVNVARDDASAAATILSQSTCLLRARGVLDARSAKPLVQVAPPNT